jgi:hypothetical protein
LHIDERAPPITGIPCKKVPAQLAPADVAFAISSAQPRNELGVNVPVSIASIVSSRGICLSVNTLKPAFNLSIAQRTDLMVRLCLFLICSNFASDISSSLLLFVIVL